ncbi:GNAT family N-acetyltransferase [uncultured Flavonifractor sp.]|uniref:GNAT family N-acetyltransferase n=1 Tax=uncultured Flavonifractor sp. TaxID=1193534 RepID=UPI00260D802B|nr:GNAT family N-acetyltransferase [uncultured Flavonifractor sp.]
MRRFVFRSPRLGFLACDPALAQAAAAFYRRNRAAFAPFDPAQPEEFFTAEGQAERLSFDLEQAEASRSFRFLLVQPRHPGKIIGLAGLNEIVRGAFQSCFISYKLDHTLWGQGYGAEAIAALTEWGFRNLGLHRVEANIMPRNLPSRRAAARAGFEEEGLAKRYLKINGVWEDHIHMVRRNEEEDL